jgi:hydroxymethylbilane synthase
MQPLLKIGTRSSPLALKQVDLVIAALGTVDARFLSPDAVEIVPLVTSGDTYQGSLADVGGKGLFTKEIDTALLSGRVDIAVHSAKDMQTMLPDGLVFAATLPRADARDVLISPQQYTLANLPYGARVGTSSLRRGLMMKHKRPDVQIIPIRGNVQTRLRKVEAGEFDATILALAGLKRMGTQPLSGMILELDECLPAPAQGIIAIQCRENDDVSKALLVRINHSPTLEVAKIERMVLRALDGSCRTPIAAYAEHIPEGVYIRAMLGDEKTGQVAYAEVRGAFAESERMVREIVTQLRC